MINFPLPISLLWLHSRTIAVHYRAPFNVKCLHAKSSTDQNGNANTTAEHAHTNTHRESIEIKCPPPALSSSCNAKKTMANYLRDIWRCTQFVGMRTKHQKHRQICARPFLWACFWRVNARARTPFSQNFSPCIGVRVASMENGKIIIIIFIYVNIILKGEY